jgi:hypothetical protein
MFLGGVIANQLVGTFSDVIAPLGGNSAFGIRWSMTLGAMAALWAGIHYWRAGDFVRDDLAVVRCNTEALCANAGQKK